MVLWDFVLDRSPGSLLIQLARLVGLGHKWSLLCLWFSFKWARNFWGDLRWNSWPPELDYSLELLEVSSALVLAQWSFFSFCNAENNALGSAKCYTLKTMGQYIWSSQQKIFFCVTKSAFNLMHNFLFSLFGSVVMTINFFLTVCSHI